MVFAAIDAVGDSKSFTALDAAGIRAQLSTEPRHELLQVVVATYVDGKLVPGLDPVFGIMNVRSKETGGTTAVLFRKRALGNELRTTFTTLEDFAPGLAVESEFYESRCEDFTVDAGTQHLGVGGWSRLCLFARANHW
jgi:hypothetical protein